ncbi:obscurin-like protein 1 [Neosynchiropus ocellatus]
MDVFGGAPRFFAYPRPVVVQSGTDAVLKCQIGGDPRPAVIWERNNEKLDPQGRYRVFEDGNVYNLIISSVTIEDSGQYICKAKNCIGETYAAATLKVEGEAQEMELREENKPRFLIKPLSTRAGRGEDAVFSCKLWGNPRPEVVWEKDGRKLNEIFESTHFSVSYQDGGWFHLKIFKTRAPDGGVYTCKARNEYGEALAGAVLLVDAGPGHDDDGTRNGYTNGHWKSHQGKQRTARQLSNRLKDDTVTKSTRVKMFAVTEGKHAKFRCFVTGKPKPEIIWRKDGRLILSGRRYLLYEDREGYFTLKVLYCKQKDNGVYVCAASNTAGQTLSAVHLSVKEPPVRFKQPLIDLEVWERDLAVLECEVPEDSVPITWYLEDRRLQPGAKYGMEEWGTKRRLTIRDIGVDDDGIYLCEMPDGGRSIAEVAVKGTITRKLPRKVDVLEGENAAFCVEVEKEEMDIHWYKDGAELRETHQTILKSFGRTHILVFVNTMPQDSGLVTFLVGRSKTSSQLRVKAAKHCPPSCPVGVQINTERANAALLSWVPAQDSRKNPPSGYVLERQEVGTGSQEWLQCLTTDTATSVEILGDSVPCEADYRFRICSVNKYGKSNNVEFPRAVHLVPVARIQAPLQDALVPEGQDAVFSIELSASVIGSWFLNGTQLQEDERYSMRRSRTHQSLRILGVRDSDNGAEITFIAYGIRDSAALYIQEMDRNKFVEIGNPIVLYCELSDPLAPVHWYKNGVELSTKEGLHIQSEGTMRRIVIQSAELSHSGVYCCDAIDDVIRFNVEVEALPVTYSTIADIEKIKSLEVGKPLVLEYEAVDTTVPVFWYKDAPPVTFADLPKEELFKCVVEKTELALSCEVSRADGVVQWYKDGPEIHQSSNISIKAEGIKRSLTIHSPQLSDTGMYTCRAGDNALMFKVYIREPPVMIIYPKEDVHLDRHVPEEIILSCELSRPNGVVGWFKDGQKLQESENIKLKIEGPYRRLKIISSGVEDSGEYVCDTADDSIFFHLNITEPPVRIVSPSQSQMELCQQTSERMVLSCEISRPNAVVRWYRDGLEVEENDNLILEVDGVYRRLIIPETTVKDSAEYVCDTADDSVTFFVNIAEPPVRFVRPRKMASRVEKTVGDSLVLDCEVSRSNATVVWKRNGEEVEDSRKVTILEDGVMRQLTIHSVTVEDAGQYICDAKDDVMDFHVKVQEMKVKIIRPLENIASVKGKIVTLRCEINKPKGDVQWLKDGQEIAPNRHHTIRAQGRERSLTIHELVEEDGGEYACETTDDRTSATVTVQTPRVVEFIAELRNITVCEGEDAVFKCVVSPEDTELVWRLNGEAVAPSERAVISNNGLCHMLCIHNCMVSDSGRVTADAEGSVSEAELQVQEQQVLFTKKMTPLVAEEYSEATLEVEVSVDSGEVQWMRQGVLIHPGAKYTPKHKGRKRNLTIHKLTMSDRGTYSCETLHDRTQAQLTVEPRKVAIKKGLTDIRTTERETATFEVELSHPNVAGTWMRNGINLKPTNHFRMSAKGLAHSLTISNLSVEDTGTFVFSVENLKTTARLVVKERELVILHDLEDLSLQEDQNAVFVCEVSVEDVPGEWYKHGEPIQQTSTIKIRQEGTKHFLLMCNVRPEDSGEIKFVARDLESVAHLDVEELPVNIVKPLQDRTALEKSRVMLDCTVSNPRSSIRWYKGCNVVLPSERFEICSEGCFRKLVIQQVALDDEGTYSVQVGDYSCSAKLTVEAQSSLMVRELQDVEVVAPNEACFECEVSVPLLKSPVWTLNGEPLQPCSRVLLEKMGTVHRLTLRQTSADMSGVMEFTSGKAKSRAALRVMDK